jgi:pyruvoyl-dependent arginine decarboxylase (PvlArgDC)
MWRIIMANITMSIEDQLLKSARKIAIEKDTSLTGLIRDYLKELVEEKEVMKEITAAELESMFSLSEAVVGEIKWSRDDLHD